MMLSIQPEWCELIASGKKTIEIRKTKPKLETPFKCYIYCTKKDSTSFKHVLNGKVIGEFVCDEIKYINPSLGYLDATCIGKTGYILDKCRLSEEELSEYGKGASLFGWHISDLIIYDEPQELRKFGLVRPPQSWCYVEEVVR